MKNIPFNLAFLLLSCAFSLAGCDIFASTEARMERAESQVAARDFRAAAIELKNVLQSEPANGRARYLLAEASWQLGDVAEAEKELRRAYESGFPKREGSDLEARLDLEQAHFADLLKAIETNTLVVPEPALSVFKGRALLGMTRLDEAEAALNAALANRQDDPAALLGLAEVAAARGDMDAALVKLGELTTHQPQFVEGWLVQGGLLARRGRVQEATKSLEAAASRGREALPLQRYALLLGLLTESRLASGDLKGASTSHAELAGIASGSPITGFLGARIAIANQDYVKATADLQRLVNANPGFTAARFFLGAVLLSQGNLQQADVQLAQVVQAAPDNLEARKLLARTRLRLDHPDAAIQVLMPALQGDAEDVQVSALMGAAQMQAGNDDKAIEVLERSVVASPRNDALRDDLAIAYLRRGDGRKALDLLVAAGDPASARRLNLVMTALVAAKGARAADVDLSRLIDRQAGNVEMLNVAAGFYLRQSDFVRSRAILAKALALKPGDPGTLTNLARVENAAGNPDLASASLDAALKADPAFVPARVAYVEIAARRGDPSAAIRQLEDWRTLDAKAVEPRLRLVQMYLANRQADRVAPLVAEALAIAPSPGPVQNAIGLMYLDAGRYDEAAARLREATESDAGNVSYWLNLSRAQSALGQRPAAREAVNRALALDPGSVAAVGTAALMDLGEGNSASANLRIKQLQAANAKEPSVWSLEGDLRMAQRQYPEASRAFDQARALREDATTVIKSYRARQLGKLPAVTEPLSEWLSKHPEDVAVRGVLAEAYQLAGQRTRAAAEYETLVNSGIRTASVFNNLAWLYYELGDARAVETSRQAYALAPQVPAVVDTHAWILVERGRVDEGLKLLEKVVQLAPDNPDIAFHHASALAKAGRHDEARRRVKALLERFPEFGKKSEVQRLVGDLV